LFVIAFRCNRNVLHA